VAWSPSGAGTYTTVAARVELVAVPYALGLRLPATEATSVPGNALAVTNSGPGTGNAISGLTVTLLRVSRPIFPTTADC